jgi:hypothetical protein
MSAKDIPPASNADLERLRDAMKGGIDTSDIPEAGGFQRLKRGANGVLPPRKSIIREAVERQIKALGLTVYRVWQMAHVHSPTLSQSAVHEFLKGQRQLELQSIEALLAAMQLRVVKKHGSGRRKPQRPTKLAGKKTVHRLVPKP